MRHTLRGLVVAAITMLATAVAMAGNQETADLIARNLHDSGKLSGYQIKVNFQEGTAWLIGRVRSDEQMATALKLAFSTRGVERVVNNLAVDEGSAQPAAAPSRLQAMDGAYEPEQTGRNVSRRVASSPRLPPAPVMEDEDAVQPTSAIEPTAQEAAPKKLPANRQPQQPRMARRPLPVAYTSAQPAAAEPVPAEAIQGAPQPMYSGPVASGPAPIRYDQPAMPNYAWPSYASYPNYASLTYPRQYSPSVWPYIGPFYPYPQVPLGWRKVTLEWDDGWWWLDFRNTPACHRAPVGRHY